MKTSLQRLVLFVAILSQLLLPLPLFADHVDVKWEMSDLANLGTATQTANSESLLTPKFSLGANLTATATMTGSNAADGFTSHVQADCH